MRHRGAVAVHDLDILDPDPEFLGNDLGERRLQALAVGGDAEGRRNRAGRIDFDRCALGTGVDRHARRRRDTRADARQFGIGRDSDADQPAPLPRRRLPGPPFRIAEPVERRTEALLEFRAVPDDSGAGLVGKFLVAHQVPRPHLRGVHVQPPGRHVDQPLHDEGRDRPADAAIRPGRRLRGRDRAHPPAVVRDPVGAGQEAHDLDRLQRRRPGIDRIGADIADDVGLQPKKPPVRVERQFRPDNLVESLAGRRQVFHAVAGPFDRPAEAQGEGADHDFLRIERGLGAEAAANIGRHDPQAVARQVEYLGQSVAQQAGYLGRPVERQRPPAGVELGEIAAVLDCCRRLAPDAEPVFHNQRGVLPSPRRHRPARTPGPR